MVLLNCDIMLSLRDPRWGEALSARLKTIGMVTCNVVIAEVLGNRALDKSDAFYYAELFETMRNQPFDAAVVKHVIEIRRSITIDLPDAIVAASAITSDSTLWTHDSATFKRIRHLELFDPLG